jgi:GxxExxY protein
MEQNSIPFLKQHPVPLVHETIRLDAGFRAGEILDNKIIIELKNVEALADIYYKQLLT